MGGFVRPSEKYNGVPYDGQELHDHALRDVRRREEHDARFSDLAAAPARHVDVGYDVPVGREAHLRLAAAPEVMYRTAASSG